VVTNLIIVYYCEAVAGTSVAYSPCMERVCKEHLKFI